MSRDRFAALGALKQSILEDYRGPTGAFFTDELRRNWIAEFRKDGFTAPTSWYKIYTKEIARPVEQRTSCPHVFLEMSLLTERTVIPDDRKFPPASAPIFFGAARDDQVCIARLGIEGFQRPQFKDHKVTIHEYDADHWLVLSVPKEITHDLEAWIEGL